MRPHRHRRNGSGAGFECFLVLQGAIALLLFNSEGEMQQQLHLSAKVPTHGIEVAEDQFHTMVALEADSMIFELKQGPYQPSQDKDFLNGFPQEGTTEAARQESQWRNLL
ncbi:cupin fold metalloprotein/ WbuC family [Synechococcus sp. TAK9802]|nr:cupin fold metalloprotein/ WbuC family [Synechococcus sp. TAK9802]